MCKITVTYIIYKIIILWRTYLKIVGLQFYNVGLYFDKINESVCLSVL